MRKMLLTPLMVGMIVLLCMLPMPVYAAPPVSAEGYFDYTFTITGTRVADGNLFIYATEDEIWVGDLAGTSQAAFRVEIFTEGFWNVWLRSTFTGTVQGKSGTLNIQLVGKRTMWDAERFWWYGQWVIISGTGELENLHGQGNWWGPGFGAVGPDIFYSGQIRFN